MTRKSPAQLDREIATALRQRRSVEDAAHAVFDRRGGEDLTKVEFHEEVLGLLRPTPGGMTSGKLTKVIDALYLHIYGGSTQRHYEEAKAKGAVLEAEVDAADAALKAFPRSAMGLISDAVKQSAEYRSAKARFDRAFTAVRTFNATYTKTFAKELRAERDKRYGR